MVNMLIIKLAPHQLPCHQLPMMRKRRRRMRKQVCFSFTPVLDFFLLKFSFISTDLTFKRICVCENWHNELNLVWVAEGWVIWNEVFVLFSSLGYLYHFLINVIRFFLMADFFFLFSEMHTRPHHMQINESWLKFWLMIAVAAFVLYSALHAALAYSVRALWT